MVGYCYSRQGKFAEALPWFERAVTAAEKGDVHGRVDPESLGTSLHRVGDCYARLGKAGEAQSWFERASMVLKRGPYP
jgi:tetratricopeptide (TPR) repeat protein